MIGIKALIFLELLHLILEAAILALIALDLTICRTLKELGKERKQERKDRPGYGPEDGAKDRGTGTDLRKFALKIFLVSFMCSLLLVLVQQLCRS